MMWRWATVVEHVTKLVRGSTGATEDAEKRRTLVSGRLHRLLAKRLLPGQSQLRRNRFHRLDAEGDVLLEVDAHLGGAVDDVVAADGAGEGFVLHLLPDRLGFNFGQ